ncbi:hypothetical protein LEP1GSC060_0646 [Leptospira weilii serovar Ranarum str. ICFT]|uniref:Uncharacterized protein n=1 Tax=Leptospira weilii serovar Ranarum str. ICFT TaxID=1218598 RepID=N1WM66_9LEPT|nr:hypothetical protein LEP1GSC060_0646 [Leptospira weilii serovar Ranarum str. ICFT]
MKLDRNQTNEILKHVLKDHKVSWQNIETKIDFNLLKNKIEKGLESKVFEKVFGEIVLRTYTKWI